MLAVFKKEWLGYFRNLIGWIFLAVTTFFLGWYFRYYGLERGLPYVSYQISATLFVFIFAFSILTMRSFAEEKRQRTDQLLFTVPVPVWKIVVGKYLASVCVFLPVVVLFILYSLILGVFGDIPVQENFLAVLCFIFFGMACISIGIFLSVLTENQVIAAVMTFFVLLMSSMIPSVSQMIGGESESVRRILTVFDLTRAFDQSLYGIFYFPSYLYYISVILIMLGLTIFTLSRSRIRMATHGIFRVFSSVFSMTVVIAGIVALNLLCTLIPQSNVSMDFTYNKIRSITDEGKALLDSLTEDITIYVLAEEEEKDETLDATLSCMDDYTGHVTVNYVSPELNPYFYLNYTDEQPVANSMIVVSADKSRVINYYDCYQVSYEYSYNMATGKYEASDYKVSGYDGEGRLMSAILYVTSDHITKIACITGHDELDLPAALKDALDKNLYEVESIQLINHEEIPEDVDILFILGPFVDYNEEEIAKVRDYLAKGKSAVLVCAFTDGEDPANYYSILGDYGIEVLPGVVSESNSSYYNSIPYYLLPEIVDTDITRTVYTPLRTKYVYFPFAKGLRITGLPEITCEILLRSSDSSYIGSAMVESGPFDLGVYVEKVLPEGMTKLLVLSSDYFLYEEIDQAVSGNNYEMFLRGVGRLAYREEKTGIPVKSYEYAPLMVGAAARGIFSVIFIGLIPVVLMTTGIYIYYYRRKE